MPAKRLRALRKGSLTSKLERVSLTKGPSSLKGGWWSSVRWMLISWRARMQLKSSNCAASGRGVLQAGCECKGLAPVVFNTD
eukprot:1154030-Pelagomonas_calceolata.AAC.2